MNSADNNCETGEQSNAPAQAHARVFKTPISTLQEYCQKLAKTPQYDLTALEGRAHQPQFVYRCMVGDITATGQGGSKKQAKHAAAEAVLKALTSTLAPEDPEPTKENLVATKPVNNHSEPDDTNPVGSLQELVVARGWRLPEYSLVHETGPAHKKEFIICCTVESFKEYGSGSAKKHAKRLAAANMYHKIMNLPPEAKENITSQCRDAKSKVSFDELYNSAGEKLNCEEIDFESNDSPCQKLIDLARKYNFEVSFKNISHNTSYDERQCFIELHTEPAVVFNGCGVSLDKAHSAAAISALEYLKLISNLTSDEPEK